MSPSSDFNTILREWSEIFMRLSMHEFMDFSKESGLTMTQLSVMMKLYHSGAKGVSDIAEYLGVTNAAASQMVERLVQMDLLERTQGQHDRRVKEISLTSAGRRLIEEGIETRLRWMEKLTFALSPEQQESIGLALTSLTEAARKLDNPYQSTQTIERSTHFAKSNLP